MHTKMIKYIKILQDSKNEERKSKLRGALVPVMHKKMQVLTLSQPGLALKILKLNKLAKNFENERLFALIRKYLES